MAKTRREFTAEFKREAVALWETSGRPQMEIAAELMVGASDDAKRAKWLDQIKELGKRAARSEHKTGLGQGGSKEAQWLVMGCHDFSEGTSP